MNQQKTPQQLSKILSYVLGRKPDEFGMVPDEDGYVKIKELLKSLSEEPDYRWIRRSNIDDILYMIPDPPFEIQDNSIRAKHRDHLPGITPAEHPPQLLYACVRRRAYANVFQNGIFPANHSHVILSSVPEMAERIGKRSDQSPVLLTVLSSESMLQGVAFYQAGDILFLADFIPPDCFTGPPLPREEPEFAKKETKKKKPEPPTPGTFYMDLDMERDRRDRSNRKKKKEISRKRDQDRKRKHRERDW